MKIFAVLPAYEAQETLVKFLDELPWNKFTSAILVDDHSIDSTYSLAHKFQKQHPELKLYVYQNTRNLGYGGNLIRSLSIALEKGADAIVELHPDGEYGLDGVDPAIAEIENGSDLVLGNRFSKGKPEGMYWSKYLVSKFISYIHSAYLLSLRGLRWKSENEAISLKTRLLRLRLAMTVQIPDLHQGFRVYSRRLLRQIPFHTFSFDYLFSWQIILAAIRLNANIKSVPVIARYQGKKRGANWLSSIKYTIQTIPGILGFSEFVKLGDTTGASMSLRSRLAGEAISPVKSQQYHINCPFCHQNYFTIPGIQGFPESLNTESRWQIFFCRYCQITFTHPQPKNIAKYYGANYWQPPGILGELKLTIFRLAQRRRISWICKHMSLRASNLTRPEAKQPDNNVIARSVVTKQSVTNGLLRSARNDTVLDVGAGEGIFGTELNKFRYHVTSLDTPSAKLQNQQVLKQDFLTWNPRQKFDCITFWESFEHVADPVKYLQKSKQLLKPGGLLFIEYPRYNSLEAKIFKNYWFNLDLPRHLFHYKDQGLAQLLKDQNFTILENRGIWAAEYSPGGLVYSIVSLITRSPLNEKFRYSLTTQIFLFTPLFLLATIIEYLLYLFGESPIGLMVASSNSQNITASD